MRGVHFLYQIMPAINKVIMTKAIPKIFANPPSMVPISAPEYWDDLHKYMAKARQPKSITANMINSMSFILLVIFVKNVKRIFDSLSER